MVWAWMRDSMISEHERYHGLGMDAFVIVCSSNTNVIVVWAWSHFFGMLSEHERYYGLGMVAQFMVCSVIVCSRNTNIIMVLAWMHYLSYALGTRTLLWCGHGCTCYRMLSQHERYYGLGIDALAFALVRSSLKNAMRGIRSISGPRNTSNVWFVPRRPHPERQARCAFFARLRSGGANNNISKNLIETPKPN